MKKQYYNKGKQVNGALKNRKILSGKGKEYSEVSKETEAIFHNWLNFSGVQENEFDDYMKAKPHKVQECINEDGNIEIGIFAGEQQILSPLLFQVRSGGSLDDFIVNALLLFSYIAARYTDKSFDEAVKKFADRMVEERKLTL